MNSLVIPGALGVGLCHTKHVPSGRRGASRCRRRALQTFSVIDIGSFRVEIGQFANKWRIAVITRSLERSRLNLAHHTDLVAGRNESLHMYV
jgi:hypothetical protein